MKRAVVLLGSPRARGISDAMGEIFHHGLEKAGMACTLIAVRDFAVVPCAGCNVCASKPHVCPLSRSDSAEELFNAIESADLLAVACPVYFYGLPAHFKALIDRSQRYWNLGLTTSPDRPLVVLLAAGRIRGERLFSGCLSTLALFGNALGFQMSGKFLLRGTDQNSGLWKVEAKIKDPGATHWADLLPSAANGD